MVKICLICWMVLLSTQIKDINVHITTRQTGKQKLYVKCLKRHFTFSEEVRPKVLLLFNANSSQWGLFLSGSQQWGTTKAAIEANNGIYCLRKTNRKVPAGRRDHCRCKVPIKVGIMYVHLDLKKADLWTKRGIPYPMQNHPSLLSSRNCSKFQWNRIPCLSCSRKKWVFCCVKTYKWHTRRHIWFYHYYFAWCCSRMLVKCQGKLG